MLLNDNVPATEPVPSENNEQAEEAEQVPEQGEEPMQVDQENSTNVQKGVDEEIAAIGGEENKSGDLDIESMLAAIHNDAPSTVDGETQNIV